MWVPWQLPLRAANETDVDGSRSIAQTLGRCGFMTSRRYTVVEGWYRNRQWQALTRGNPTFQHSPTEDSDRQCTAYCNSSTPKSNTAVPSTPAPHDADFTTAPSTQGAMHTRANHVTLNISLPARQDAGRRPGRLRTAHSFLEALNGIS